MVNKVILLGNLGKDPETRYTQSGTAVCNFNIATTKKWKSQDGQQNSETEWHRIVVWQKLAELCQEYLHKGSKVYLEGEIHTKKWQDQQGADRYTTEIVAREVKFLDTKPQGDGYQQHQGPPQNQQNNQPPQQQQQGTGSDVPF